MPQYVDGKITGTLSAQETIRGRLSKQGNIKGGIALPDGYEKNYERLTNKPKINGVELIGNKTIEQLGVSPMTNMEIQIIFNNVFNRGG